MDWKKIMIRCEVSQGAFTNEWVFVIPLYGEPAQEPHEGAAPTSAVVSRDNAKVGVEAFELRRKNGHVVAYVPGGDVIKVDAKIVEDRPVVGD